ncbi:glyoxalase [Rhizobium sp. Leaf384]|uniref:VOC family protein n=1 Tax=unclassified Rhizobium TaxID=2613769 RepID=UPI0007138FC5|nr:MULTISPECIES: VOC family protein [unclassified Rhizobium]KQS77443.1 glyoxalase [Rhizobium sp. Leaf383]KQS80649.1 glyoxalase [Rhizobium sp. Leaf384]
MTLASSASSEHGALPHPGPEHPLSMPAFVDHARLVVRDLPLVSSWYQAVMGLRVMERRPSGETLGVGGRPLLTLTTSNHAALAPRNAPGLFHTAFLVPDRPALARWLVHAARQQVALDGASDHLVSEAIYLADPEGNGIEIYRDRPRADWTTLPDGMVKMATRPLDLQSLYAEGLALGPGPASGGGAGWAGMEPGTALGHLHLQVSDLPAANGFFRDVLGLDIISTYPGASFFSTGRYHHHLAANVWNTRDAPRRSADMTGLGTYTLRFTDGTALQTALAALDRLEIPTTRHGDSVSLTDPFGIGLTLST